MSEHPCVLPAYKQQKLSLHPPTATAKISGSNLSFLCVHMFVIPQLTNFSNSFQGTIFFANTLQATTASSVQRLAIPT